jgi:hypothetical protein
MNAFFRFVVVFAVLVTFPSVAMARQQTFTVAAPAAIVRSEPRLGSPVVKEAPRGTVLAVVGARGEWLAVSLDGADGSLQNGFVSATLGSLSGDATYPPAQGVQSGTFGQPMDTAPRAFGLGGHVGGFTFGVGANARYWSSDRVGVQFGYSRFSIGDGSNWGGVSYSSKVSVNQLAPTVLVRFGEPQADDDVVFRPHAGGGLNMFRTTVSASASIPGMSFKESESENSFGFQALGGAEIGFRSVPRLTVSGDLGYYSTGTSFGVQLGGFAYGVSLHWYLK